MENESSRKIGEILKLVKEKDLYPEIRTVEDGLPSGSEFIMNGKKM